MMNSQETWVLFLESPITFRTSVCIQYQSFIDFETDIMKLSVNEAKVTDLWTRNCATIQLDLISKFAFGPEKLPGRLRNGPLIRY